MEIIVYILRCADGSYYTGLTKQNIEARLWEHNEGIYDSYTKKRRPVELVFTETYGRIVDAIARERQIKGWSREERSFNCAKLRRLARTGEAKIAALHATSLSPHPEEVP